MESERHRTVPSVPLRLRKIERQPSSRERKDRHRRLKNRKRSGCRGCASLTVREWLTVETEEQREARLQRMRANQSDRLAAETEEQSGQAAEDARQSK